MKVRRSYTKQALSLLLSVVLAVGMVPSVALVPSSAWAHELESEASLSGVSALQSTYSGTCGDNLTWTLDTETGVLIVSGTGDMDSFYGTGEPPWRQYADCVQSIVIEEGVTTIGYSAFKSLTQAKTISLPSTMGTIFLGAFVDMPSLESFTVAEGNEDWSAPDGRALYYRQYELEAYAPASGSTYQIPEGITSITYSAFSACDNLTSISLPSTLTSILDRFENCPSLTSFSVDSSNTTFSTDGKALFKDGSIVAFVKAGVTSYSVPSTITAIDESAFESCQSLEEITIPGNVTAIGNDAFYQCPNLKTVYLSEGLTSIGQLAFDDCPSLFSIEIPATVTTIGWSAFGEGIDGRVIVLPEGSRLSSISNYAFDGNGGYSFYICCGTAEMKSAVESSLNGSRVDVILGDGGSVARGNAGINWIFNSETSELFFTGSGAIPDFTLQATAPWTEYKDQITTLTIPEWMTGIGNYAFCNMSAITSVTVPTAVASIGDNAFAGCSSLASVEIEEGSSLAHLGSSVFVGLPWGSTITVHDQGAYNELVDGANYDSANTTIVYDGAPVYPTGTCGDNMTWTFDTDTGVLTISGTGKMYDYSIENPAPWSELDVTEVLIDESVKDIGAYAFYDMESISSVTIEAADVASIREGAFMCGAVNISVANKDISRLLVQGYNYGQCSIGDPGDMPGIPPVHKSDISIVSDRDEPLSYTYTNERVVEEPTCTEFGKKTVDRVFSDGSVETLEIAIEPLGHDYDYQWEVDEEGHYVYDPETSSFVADGWFVVQEPTVYAKGTEGMRCLRCDYVSYRSIAALSTDDPIEAFAARLYSVILGRDGDESGFYTQVAALRAGVSPAEIAYNYFNSKEYFDKHETAEQTVERVYRVMFGRASDEAGKAFWVGFMESGMSVRKVIAGFSQAEEYRVYFGSLGLDCSEIPVYDSMADQAWNEDGTQVETYGNNRDLNQGATEFAKRMYTVVLSREDSVGTSDGIDVAGLNVQAGAIAKGMPCWQIAVNYFCSSEFKSKHQNDWEQQVRIAYAAILGRTEDEIDDDTEGITYWVKRLKKEGMESVVKGFCQSDEFEAICQRYGLVSGMR